MQFVGLPSTNKQADVIAKSVQPVLLTGEWLLANV